MSGSFISCAACLRQAMQATARRSRPLIEANTPRHGTSSLATLPQQTARWYAATVAAVPEINDTPQSLNSQPIETSALQTKNRERLERIVKKHMNYMDDPWKIAQYVEQTLEKDRYDEALLLVQKASKDRQVVVAWNHLINYQLQKQQIRLAVKLYNEMKKRGQLPNVQTFTVFFRGCARSQHPKMAVAEAVRLYNVLLTDKRLQPNSIHLNAVLNVCAKAGDLDSMFLIANTINDSTRLPTPYTYTTILNALRFQALKDIDDMTLEQLDANKQQAVDRAKSIWEEVMDKWRKARLVLDEELVCAMGRILLIAPKREEKREVLDLLQQTMSIPNLAKSSDPEAFQDSEMENIAMTGSSKPVPATRTVYAIPGENTLALVLTTVASAKLATCGIKYWNLMVRHYGIVPDNDIWLRMFGMLKVAKASAHASTILDLIPEKYIHDKPYRIAMETCVRDNINMNAIENADRVLDSMLARLPVPDLHALRLYLRVALVSHYHLRARAQKGDITGAKRDYGNQIATALARLWEPYKKTHYHYFKEASASPSPLKSGSSSPRGGKHETPGSLYNNQREVIALARLMFSAFNKVINERMLPEDGLRELRPVGAKINREIQKFYSNREEIEPKLAKNRRNHDDYNREASAVFTDGAHDENALNMGFKPSGDFVWNTNLATYPKEKASYSEERSAYNKGRSSYDKEGSLYPNERYTYNRERSGYNKERHTRFKERTDRW